MPQTAGQCAALLQVWFSNREDNVRVGSRYGKLSDVSTDILLRHILICGLWFVDGHDESPDATPAFATGPRDYLHLNRA